MLGFLHGFWGGTWVLVLIWQESPCPSYLPNLPLTLRQLFFFQLSWLDIFWCWCESSYHLKRRNAQSGPSFIVVFAGHGGTWEALFVCSRIVTCLSTQSIFFFPVMSFVRIVKLPNYVPVVSFGPGMLGSSLFMPHSFVRSTHTGWCEASNICFVSPLALSLGIALTHCLPLVQSEVLPGSQVCLLKKFVLCLTE